jgi:D-glycero-D-manno-heptose 1,7-bisphosphate phosphatase
VGVAPLTGRPAVFLDRDGVLNRAPAGTDGVVRPPETLEALEVMPGAAEACALLRASGYALVIVTNQPDVPRGRLSHATVEAMNRRVATAVGIDDVRVCYHDGPDRCACRKPAPGMLVDAARDRGLDLTRSFIVGDSWRDVEAGRRAGCRTVFVGRELSAPYQADIRADDVLDAARKIVAEKDGQRA